MPHLELPSASLHYMQLPCRTPQQPCEEVVLIHGLAANLAFWNVGVVLPLAEYFNVTAYDLRGHGRSSMPSRGYGVQQLVDDLERLLDHLRIERMNLIAHSFGGTIAVLFALRHPERVTRMILVDSRLRALQAQQRMRDWRHWPQWQRVLRRAGIEIDENDPEGGYQVLVEMARLQLANPQLAEDLPRLFARMPGGKRKLNMARRWLEMQEATSIRSDFTQADGIEPEQLRGLTMPVLGVYGEYSNTLPTAYAMERLCPNYHLHIVNRAGHFFPLSQPRRLARASLRFFAAHRKRTQKIDRVVQSS